MLIFLIRRSIHSLLVVLAASAVVFMLSHLTGDPAALLLPPEATSVQLEEYRRAVGLDRPVHEQYLSFLGRALQGDLGRSLWTQRPVAHMVVERLPATGLLAGAAMLLALLVAVPAGVIAALNRRRLVDSMIVGFTALGQSMPTFWLGLVLILLFSVELGWFPVSGSGSLRHLVLPAVTLGAFSTAQIARLIRAGVIETMQLDYIRTARAKGLLEYRVVMKHAMINSLIPVITVFGLQFGTLLGGAIITEEVFAWPGLGRLIVQAVTHRDYPLLQAAVLFVALGFVIINLVVDLLYAFLDPRIAYS